MKRGGRQRVLIGAPVEIGAHQLLRRSIGHRSHRHIGGGQSADVGQLARYPEVRQQDPSFAVFWLGEQDVGRFDVAMQQTSLVCVVERAGDRCDDGAHVVFRHPIRIQGFHQLSRVGALDVVHRDPQLTLELASVVHADDVRMKERGGQVGFAVEPAPKFGVRRDIRRQVLSAHRDGAASGVRLDRPRPCLRTRAAEQSCTRRTSDRDPMAWPNKSPLV